MSQILIFDKSKYIIMKIAVPTKDKVVDDHFGHCAFYTVFEIENGKVVNKQRLDSPAGCGCKSNIASVLKNMGVTVMLAGNIGAGAINVLNAHDVKVIRGCSGDVDVVAEQYIVGKLTDSGQTCSHHGSDGHVCSH